MRSSLFKFGCALALWSAAAVHGQGEPEDIKVPQNPEWLAQVDLSQVPKIPIRPVGSGVCKDAVCDGSDNDRCFESCGNKPTPSDIYGCPHDHQWALTFDDGPSNYTSQLLDILDKYGIKATFCMMGAHVEKYPEIVKRAYESGHQIASHTYSHPHLMSLTNEQIINEVRATEEAIMNVIGIKPRYLRPPFGEADDRVKALLKAMGYKVLLWNVDPTDYDVYMLPDAPKKIQGAFRMAAAGKDTGLNAHEDAGFISLQHDLYKESVEQVPRVIEYLKKRGFKFMTAAECLDDPEPHDVLEDPLIVQNVKGLANSTTTTTPSPSSSVSMPSLPVVQRIASNDPSSSSISSASSSTMITHSPSILFIALLVLALF